MDKELQEPTTHVPILTVTSTETAMKPFSSTAMILTMVATVFVFALLLFLTFRCHYAKKSAKKSAKVPMLQCDHVQKEDDIIVKNHPESCLTILV